LVCYEAPHRLLEALEDVVEVLGVRQVVIACELTKMFEHIWRGTAGESVEYVRASPARGEYTLVIQGASDASAEIWTEGQVVRALEGSVRGGASRKDAAAQVAAQAHWSRRAVYSIASKIATNT
jgi:16S rRNA (cytidine1402-2'-O)-methyltransferase